MPLYNIANKAKRGKKMEKKGQAAMEFLMTYGWAILVVLVAIGALAYFGVLSPEKLLPRTCTLVAGLSCSEFKVTKAGTATIVVLNGMGKDLESISMTLTPKGETTPISMTPINDTIIDGATGTYTCTVDEGTGGFKADLEFAYTAVGETLSHTEKGTLATRYE